MEASVSQPLPDELLTRRVAAGDEAAFDELYRRYARPLAAYGARLLNDRAAGEDVAQTSLLRAYQAIRRGTEPQHVRAWLYRIAQRTAYDSRGRGELEYDPEADTRAEDLYETGASRADLLTAIQTLPERQRQAYLLRELRGLTVSEIGGELGLANEQVEQALFAARNRLAERLSFGGRLMCETVQSMERRPVDLGQRRALKAHLRSCPECRATAGGRLGGLTAFGVLASVRQLLSGFLGGGVTAAKVGTVLATAALATSAPLAAAHRLPLLKLQPARHIEATAAAPVAVSAAIAPPKAFTPAFLQPSATQRSKAAPAPTDPWAPAPAAAAPADGSADPGTQDASSDPAASDPSASDPPPDYSADPTASDPSATDPSATDSTYAADSSTMTGSSFMTDPSATDPNASVYYTAPAP